MKQIRLINLIIFCLFGTVAQARQTVVIVSSRGNDSGKGTLEHPFRTVERALSEAKQYAGDTVCIQLHSGIYPLNRTVEVSGLSHVVIASYKVDKVSLGGGCPVKNHRPGNLRSH